MLFGWINMQAKFGQKKYFKCPVIPPVGNFALDPNEFPIHWDKCREQFAVKFDEFTPGFYFSHPQDKAFNIAEFIAKFESVLEIKDLTSFCLTNKQSVLWIEPSYFWKNCQMKRSLFTLIIRCGFNYSLEKDNFDDALFGDYEETVYIKETKLAVLRFMFGFTQFVGRIQPCFAFTTVIKHGWREEFIKSNLAEIRNKLTNVEKIQENFISKGSIWG